MDKIEKYLVNANDWITIKYSIAENISYFPLEKSAVFRSGINDIIILGGERDGQRSKTYYVFDTKKLIFVAKNGKKLVKQDDDFPNQDNIVRLKDS